MRVARSSGPDGRRACDCCGARRHAELGVRVLEVLADCPLGNLEIVRDLTVRGARSEGVDDFLLAGGQAVTDARE